MLNMLLAATLHPMDSKTLLQALNILWQGLLAIFVVIGLIIVTVKLTSYVIAKCTEAKKRKEEAQNSQTDESQS